MRIETIGDATLYLGDCRDVLPGVIAHEVVTSPPYYKQRDYGAKITDWRSIVAPLAQVIDAHKTQILVNLGMVHVDCEIVEYWRPLFEDMKERGWRLFGWYTWDQGPGLSGKFGGRFAPASEFVFHFNKQARDPNKCIPCLHPGLRKSRGSKSGTRNADGSQKGWKGSETIVGTHKIPDSVIRVMRQRYSGGAIETKHPAVFPVDFASALIAPYTDEGEIVCDPFMGSGTTGVACLRYGRKFVGVEIDQNYFDIACRRLEAELKQTSPAGDLFAAAV